MAIGEVWKRSNPISKILFILILLYVPVSIYVLLWGIGVAGNIITSDEDKMWIIYAILSFSLATIIATYHLSTLIFRRKRSTDKAHDSKKMASV